LGAAPMLSHLIFLASWQVTEAGGFCGKLGKPSKNRSGTPETPPIPHWKNRARMALSQHPVLCNRRMALP
jgi:hypothetical protein